MKGQSNLEKHTVLCPHCGKPVLDHMTQCPKCNGTLTPSGYQPMSDKTRKKIRIITYSIGFALVIAVFVLVILFKS